MIARRSLHRCTFIAAGLYNLTWGLVTVLDPQSFFRWSGLPLLNHQAVFACLGMVVGLYGLIYLEIARAPEHGWALAAVGLLGKILGPIGMVQLILHGVWPWQAGVLCLSNDLIWWLPFGMYLYDAWPAHRNDWR